MDISTVLQGEGHAFSLWLWSELMAFVGVCLLAPGTGAWRPPLSLHPQPLVPGQAGRQAGPALPTLGVPASACCLFVLSTLNASLWHFQKKNIRRGRKKTTTITAYIANPPSPFSLPTPVSLSLTHPHSFPPLHAYYHSFSLSSSVWTPNIVLFMPPTGSSPRLVERLLSPPCELLFVSGP